MYRNDQLFRFKYTLHMQRQGSNHFLLIKAYTLLLASYFPSADTLPEMRFETTCSYEQFVFQPDFSLMGYLVISIGGKGEGGLIHP